MGAAWKNEMLIDAHAHLDFYDEEELPVVLERIQELGILTAANSVNMTSWRKTLQIAEQSDLVIFTDADFDGAEEQMRKIADENFDSLSYPLSRMLFEWTAEGWKAR